MKIIDKLKIVTNEIVGTFLGLEKVIKGQASPCDYCAKCEMKDDRKGICECFILKGRNEE